MAKLAIKGHATLGNEVIEILEMLGGVNTHNLYGDENYAYYTIDSDKEIKGGIYVFGDEQLCHFTLEEFLEKFPYKVGDKIMIDDRDKANIVGMVWDNDIDEVFYEIQIGVEVVKYPKELLHPYIEKIITIDDFKTHTKEWLIDKLHGMIISNAIKTIGNIHDELHKPQYPKTYKECCDILDIYPIYNKPNLCICEWHPETREMHEHYSKLANLSQKDIAFMILRICRDAYWKIAGDWKEKRKEKTIHHVLYSTPLGEVVKATIPNCIGNYLLDFPTEEMRDIFYENFKELIENCKELL